MKMDVPAGSPFRIPFLDWILALALVAAVGWGTAWLTVIPHAEVFPSVVVGVAALLTALTTGFGVFPFLFSRTPGTRSVGYGNALAAGLMLGASLSLVYEGVVVENVPLTALRVAVGAVLGGVAVLGAHRLLSGREDLTSPEALIGNAGFRRMILVVGVMTVHSFAEGMGVGVSYGEGNGFGDFIAFSIAVHNIPEGLAISLVLIPGGVSLHKTMGWCVFSSLPQPLIAVPAFLFVLSFRQYLPVGLGFAAGAMFWMVFQELLPEAREHLPVRTAVGLMLLAAGGMLLFQYAG